AHHDRDQDTDAKRDARRIARHPRIRDERAESRSGVRAAERRERLARDEEEPAVTPREDRVVDQLGDRRRQRQESEPEHAPKAETRRRGLEVDGNRRQGLVDPECHVPGHAREDQESDRELDSDGAPLKRDDKEHQRGGEEAEDRDGLQDVEEWEHDDGGPLVRGRGGPERDREDEGQQVGEDHPRRREERKEGELDRVERGLRVENRDDDRDQDYDPREDPKAPAEAAHLRPQRTGAIYGLSNGVQTPARRR